VKKTDTKKPCETVPLTFNVLYSRKFQVIQFPYNSLRKKRGSLKLAIVESYFNFHYVQKALKGQSHDIFYIRFSLNSSFCSH